MILKLKRILLLVAVSVIGLAISYITYSEELEISESYINSQTESFKHDLGHQQEILQQESELLYNEVKQKTYGEIKALNQSKFSNIQSKYGVSFYVFEGATLKFWSDNKVPINNLLRLTDGFHLLKNGWYEIYRIQKEDYTVIGTSLIKKRYDYENSFVSNHFHSRFSISDKIEIVEAGEKSIEFSSIDNKTKLYLDCTNLEPSTNKQFIWSIIELLLLTVLIFAIYKLIVQSHLSPLYKLSLVIGYLVALRALMIVFQFPWHIYQSELMSPEILAISGVIPSLGDFIFNVMVVVQIAIVFTKLRLNIYLKRVPPNSKKAYIVGLVIFIAMFFSSWGLIELIEELVMNSNIELNLNLILELGPNTFLVIIGIGLVLYAYYLIVTKILELLSQVLPSWVSQVVIMFSVYIVALCIGALLGVKDIVSLGWAIPVVLVITYRAYKQSRQGLTSSVFLILFFSIFVSHALEKYVVKKERSDRVQKAILLSSDRDPFAEYLFLKDISKKIEKDEEVMNIVQYSNQQNDLFKLLQRKYFSKDWSKFDLQVSVCKPNTTIDLGGGKTDVKCEDFFEKMILAGTVVEADRLYHLENKKGIISYIGKLSLSDTIKLYIELDSKIKPEGLGYPVLLVDKKTERDALSNGYSLAKYLDDNLILKKGDFRYSQSLSVFHVHDHTTDEQEWMYLEDYDHLVYHVDQQNTIVISKKDNGIWGKLASYSYLFAFFSIIAIIAFVANKLWKREKLFNLNFRTRLQFSIVSVLLFSVVFIGIGSIYYIRLQFNEKNFESLNDKINSIKIEVEHKLGKYDKLDDYGYIGFILDKFSNVFFTDINLYDTSGKLISSSRPRLFEEGLASEVMHPEAFYQMHINEKTHFVQIENIEGMKYLSAYVPFKNDQGELLAYLNLPYFARQNELSNEISNFLVALINIYGLLIILSIVVALFVSNQITKPLRIIQERLKGVQLGKRNELIDWKGTDEIGSLVAEYNRMVLELSESATRLANSEREGAWKEMAKQVAHEIKNPLTPMKLSVQHLKRTWSATDPDEFEERLDKVTGNLIEQIDTLSSIATEFSNFAKMPETKLEVIDMIPVLENCSNIYHDLQNTKVIFNTNLKEATVLGDKDQMIRVFNNLIKNAVQAIPEDRDGKVEIGVVALEDKITISVKDNGKGISDHEKNRIFVPNFTTKNSGMGLGLAMVKKIIEESDGNISFESEEGVGTTFFIELKKHK